LTITGVGGGGKTRLASEAARVVAPQFQHGVVMTPLHAERRADPRHRASGRAVCS
jgi:hypothetical protein